MINDQTKVLLIEDNPSDAGLVHADLQPYLPSSKVTIVEAVNLASGKALLRSQEFDVILLDLNLPDSFGLETFKELVSASNEVPVVILSGTQDDAIANAAVNQGAQDYFSKDDLGFGTLIKTIRYAVTRARLSRLEREKLQLEKEKIEQKTRIKSDFLAQMSHEIRTPMNGLIGMTSLLLRTELNGEQKEFVETIRASCEALLQIVNDILDFSKIEAGRVQLEQLPFDLNQIYLETIDLFTVVAHQKNLTLKFSSDSNLPKQLKGDPTRIRQILNNFTSNAIKFTEKGSVELQVKVIAAHAQTTKLQLAVKDSGTGIPKQVIGTLFSSFTQGDESTTRKFGGTGLGLAICKSLVRLMNGKIGVESSLGLGSTFWCEIELENAVAPSHSESAALAADKLKAANQILPTFAAQTRVLVVDDNQVNRRVAQKMLEKLGIQTDLVSSGAEAVEANRRFPYDAILMDCVMPGMDGYETTKVIRAGERARAVPIIAVTASTQADEQGKGQAAGMNDFLAKPITLNELAIKLQRWIMQKDENLKPKTAVEDALPIVDSKVLVPLRAMSEPGQPDFLNELIELFNLTAPPVIEDLTLAAARANRSQVKHLAHKLRGICNNLGAARLSFICETLENNQDELSPVQKLDQEYQQVVQALKTYWIEPKAP